MSATYTSNCRLQQGRYISELTRLIKFNATTVITLLYSKTNGLELMLNPIKSLQFESK